MPYSVDGFVTESNFIGAVAGVAIQEHRYSTNDTKATVEGAGYFNDLRDKGFIKQGDIIGVTGDRDGTPFLAFYIFSAVPTSGNVVLTEHAAVTQNVLQEISAQNISSAGGDAEVFRYVPSFAGSITKLYTVLNDALATGDATVTLAINGSAVTGGAATITQSGSAAGDVDTVTPSDANTFTAGQVITATVGGTSDATGTLNLTLQLTPA